MYHEKFRKHIDFEYPGQCITITIKCINFIRSSYLSRIRFSLDDGQRHIGCSIFVKNVKVY